MNIDEQFGCERCFWADAEKAHEALRGFREIVRLIDESHFIIRIAACPHCGQHYVSVFTELIDWKDGDDSQARDVLPVTKDESTELAAQGERVDIGRIRALGEGRRSLSVSHPRGGSLSVDWRRGKLLMMPHD